MINTNHKILLVEDNPGDVRLVELAVARSGLLVTLLHRSNGEEAIGFLHELKNGAGVSEIGVIILDLNLPTRDGFEVLEILKSDEQFKKIPVFIFTSSESDVKRAFDLRADGYVLKGGTLQAFRDSLIQSLRYWLSREPAGQRSSVLPVEL